MYRIPALKSAPSVLHQHTAMADDVQRIYVERGVASFLHRERTAEAEAAIQAWAREHFGSSLILH